MDTESQIMNFWEFTRERIAIYEARREGKPWPWTNDLVLQRYYFCNIFREWDRTTIWFRENVRDYLQDSNEIILATIIFRWFNRIEIGKVLLDNHLLTEWNSDKAKELLRGTSPIVTGAFIVKTPVNMNKLDGVCWCIDNMWRAKQTVQDSILAFPNALEWQWRALQNWSHMGPFMAYEVVTDLRHTKFGRYAHDIYTWANPGPGAKRGLLYIFPETVGPGVRKVEQMQKLLYAATAAIPNYPMEMRDIEHALCEYAKYRNALNGKRLKRVYNYGVTRPQCQPSV
jgi:hypothetical protein